MLDRLDLGRQIKDMGLPTTKDEGCQHSAGSRDSLLGQQIGVTLRLEDGSEVRLSIVESVFVDEHKKGLQELVNHPSLERPTVWTYDKLLEIVLQRSSSQEKSPPGLDRHEIRVGFRGTTLESVPFVICAGLS